MIDRSWNSAEVYIIMMLMYTIGLETIEDKDRKWQGSINGKPMKSMQRYRWRRCRRRQKWGKKTSRLALRSWERARFASTIIRIDIVNFNIIRQYSYSNRAIYHLGSFETIIQMIIYCRSVFYKKLLAQLGSAKTYGLALILYRWTRLNVQFMLHKKEKTLFLTFDKISPNYQIYSFFCR